MPFLGGVFLSLAFVSSSLTVELPKETPQDIWVTHLHECENPDNIPRILDSNNKYSYGYVEFQMDTWLSFGKKFGATPDNIGNEELQKVVAEDMLNHGLGKHWYTCNKRTMKLYGVFPATS